MIKFGNELPDILKIIYFLNISFNHYSQKGKIK